MKIKITVAMMVIINYSNSNNIMLTINKVFWDQGEWSN